MAGLPTINLRALLVGIMTADGTAPPDIPVPIGTQAQADHAFGPGSELSRMFKAFFANNFANEVWGLPVAEPVGGDRGDRHDHDHRRRRPRPARSISTSPATHVPVNVYDDRHRSDDIATAIADAINDERWRCRSRPVAIAGAVTLTAVFKGVNGNDITVSLELLRQPRRRADAGRARHHAAGDRLPHRRRRRSRLRPPRSSTSARSRSNTSRCPTPTPTSLFAWDQEYGFTDQGRWGWQRQLFGHVFSAKRGTYADLITFGETHNSGVESVMAFEVDEPVARASNGPRPMPPRRSAR